MTEYPLMGREDAENDAGSNVHGLERNCMRVAVCGVMKSGGTKHGTCHHLLRMYVVCG